MCLAHRKVLRRRLTVEGVPAGRVHHALGLGSVGAFEDVERADDIDERVKAGLGDGASNVGLRGEMEDQFGPPASHQLDDRRRCDVEVVDGQGPPCAPSSLRQVGERPGRKVVDDIDLVALDEQAVHQVGADEPCSPGDKRAHVPAF